MKKKESKKKEDCKICYGCGGCEDYETRTDFNDLYQDYEYGIKEKKPYNDKSTEK